MGGCLPRAKFIMLEKKEKILIHLSIYPSIDTHSFLQRYYYQKESYIVLGKFTACPQWFCLLPGIMWIKRKWLAGYTNLAFVKTKWTAAGWNCATGRLRIRVTRWPVPWKPWKGIGDMSAHSLKLTWWNEVIYFLSFRLLKDWSVLLLTKKCPLKKIPYTVFITISKKLICAPCDITNWFRKLSFRARFVNS